MTSQEVLQEVGQQALRNQIERLQAELKATKYHLEILHLKLKSTQDDVSRDKVQGSGRKVAPVTLIVPPISTCCASMTLLEKSFHAMTLKARASGRHIAGNIYASAAMEVHFHHRNSGCSTKFPASIKAG